MTLSQLEEKKLKDIEDISFNINQLDYLETDIDDFIIQESVISNISMEGNEKMRIDVSDGTNIVRFYIKAKNIKGQNILKDLYLSDRMLELPLESFPNLNLKYFKN